ncbi:MAG: hypothetical protein M0R74_17195 [Dehalococcoidia bacterium]|nr:hypothetical protein [Dehalococcoidia bacterium]
MKLSINERDSCLVITPETEKDFQEIKELTGGFYLKDSHDYQMAKNAELKGVDIHLADDGISIEAGLMEAWWNFDD